ncbi:hypothetical protein ColLi_00427 [Colletotrichum liriopes]|uniref:Uncharacterized protein n=1 Tax=Colletotrichum liriopes TaxID=708192 RepID=A0AA37LLY9_9PEZI|nr:hypothetical protein ColLi_00427 [Colletotrichum liriopes]
MRFTALTSLFIVALMAGVGRADRPDRVPHGCWDKCTKECIAWIVPFVLMFPKFIDCRKECVIRMYHPECREMLKKIEENKGDKKDLKVAFV